MLKDKVIVKGYDGIESSATYENLSNNYNINNINKSNLTEFFSGDNMIKIYAAFAVIAFIYLFVIYMVQILLDTLLLSVVGYLLSQIVGVKFKYKSIFNISIYALTLSILLYCAYIVVNLFTGFEIKYFTIAYNAIAYIYVVTAILMIKSDLIKQQIELTKIVEEQKKIKEEKQEEPEDKEKEKDKKKEDKKEKKKEKESKKDGEAPEGSNA